MTDDSTGDIPHVHPTKSNFLLIVIVLGAFGMMVLLAALSGGAYFLLDRNGVFARPRQPRPAASLAEKRQANVEAFGKDAAKSDANPEENEEFLSLLKRVARIKTPEQVEECFDVKRFYQEVETTASNKQIFHEAEAFEGFREGFTGKLAERSLLRKFAFSEIKRVKFIGGRDDAIVYSQHRSADGVGLKMRWWAGRSLGKWKIYDYEEFVTGVRCSAKMAAVMDGTGPQGVTSRQLEATSAAAQAATLAAQQQFDQAEQKIRSTLDVPLAKPLAAMRLAQLAIVERSRSNWDEVLEFTRRAAEFNPDMPMLPMLRAEALNGLERFEEGAAEARKYIAELGGDDYGSFLLGTALAGMEKYDEAADAFREGLGVYSDSVDNLVGLAGVLPEDQMHEVADRFSRFEQPAARFREVAAQLVTQENATALAAVLERNRELAPLDPQNSYYEGELHRLRGE